MLFFVANVMSLLQDTVQNFYVNVSYPTFIKLCQCHCHVEPFQGSGFRCYSNSAGSHRRLLTLKPFRLLPMKKHFFILIAVWYQRYSIS